MGFGVKFGPETSYLFCTALVTGQNLETLESGTVQRVTMELVTLEMDINFKINSSTYGEEAFG